MSFFAEVLVGGLLAGIMYSLIALGFVLIYKTSGVLNFAQGAMVLFAALTCVSLTERHIPFLVALFITLCAMVALGWLIERFVLGPLVNQPPITLFMATLGISYFIEVPRNCCSAPRRTSWTSVSRTNRSISRASP